jgi:hypothetical protein
MIENVPALQSHCPKAHFPKEEKPIPIAFELVISDSVIQPNATS